MSFLLTSFFGLNFLFVSPANGATGGATRDLEKAIKSGRKEILFEGNENEDLTIKKGVRVIGTSPAKATISDDIVMEDGSSLANVTVSGKLVVITIEKGASVTLTNVTVRGGKDVGIFAPSGGGTLTLKNSRITKNRKGLYILPDKKIFFTGNSISGNGEEGMDIRAAVSGTVSDNQFVGNGEGGAEIIIGSANLIISGNTFAENKASGLALQSYDGRGERAASVIVRENIFSKNHNFGLLCSSPSGGGGGSPFYASSVKALGNTFVGNGLAPIDPTCHVTNRALPKEKTEEVEEVEVEESISSEGILREKTNELFIAEDAFEKELHAKEKFSAWWKHPWLKVLPSEERVFAEKLQNINWLREAVATLPREEDTPELGDERQTIILESLRRGEELRLFLERMTRLHLPWPLDAYERFLRLPWKVW